MSSRPRILFAMSHAGFFRNFERTVDHLTEAGFDVDLVFSKRHKAITIDDYPSLKDGKYRVVPVDFGKDRQMKRTYRRRVYRDVLFYSRAEFRDASSLRDRFTDHQKGHISRPLYRLMLKAFEMLPADLRSRLDDRFEKIEARTPPHEAALQVIDDTKPDIVVVTPLVHFFTHEVEFVKAAKLRGIHTVLAVASWDNLTNKGVVKAKPDSVAAWNEAMAQEAVTLHGFAREDIVITGATVFDWWYDKGDIWDRERFYREVGLPAVLSREDAATLLYLCSSVSIASGSEVELVEKWVNAVRNATDPRIRNARIVVRLHPMNRAPWEAKLAEIANQAPEERDYTIFPANVLHPTSAEQQAYFLNSVHYADAIVGLNTSAMIEAAIMSKPVLTFKGHGAENSQMKNLHFQHLVRSGCVRLSDDLPNHVKEIGKVLGETDKVAAACRDFVSRFVRPRGLDKETAKCLAEEIAAFAVLNGQASDDRKGGEA